VPVPKEIELKLEVPPANLPRLAKIPRLRALKTPAKSATEISVYFDTENRRLHKKGLMLRVRRVGDRYVQTRTCSSATNGKAKSTAQCPTCASRKARRSSRC
jgi:triphosphatase